MKIHWLLILVLGAGLLFLNSCKKSDTPVEPQVDTQAPVVSIAQPAGGSVLTGSVSIAINVTDNSGVSKVEIYANNKIQGSSYSPPWTYTWSTTTVTDGNYSLVAWAYDGAGNIGYSSPINVSVSNPFRLSFNNTVFTDITISIPGQSTQTISPGATYTYLISGSASSVTFTAQTYGRTTTGTQVGSKLTWSSLIDLSVGKSKAMDLVTGSQYFFVAVINKGTRALSPFYVNYGTVSQSLDNITIPADGQKYGTGYYLAYTNTQVRAFLLGTNSYAYWNQGTHFTLPFTDNQSVTLTNTFSGFRIATVPPNVGFPELARKAGTFSLQRSSHTEPNAVSEKHYARIQE